MRLSNPNKGLSLVEVLIVVAIVAILIIAGIGMYLRQLEKARDSQRKSDLDKIKIAFAEYYGDNDCFPVDGALLNCKSEELKPYLREIPCDPSTEQPYRYDIEMGALCPNRYRVLTTLEIKSDPVITEVHCDGPDGCGVGLEEYNYGISDGVPVGLGEILGGGDTPANTPTPTPTLDPSGPTSTPINTPTPTSMSAPTNTPTSSPIPSNTPTPTLPASPTNTPANTPTPTSTPFPTPGGTENYCCASVCNVWDHISYCPGGVYDTLLGCISSPNACSQ